MKIVLALVQHGTDADPHETSVGTMEELDSLLDRLAAASPPDAPYMACVIRTNGDSLTLGLGSPLLVDSSGNLIPSRFSQPLTALSFLSKSTDPPYFAAVATQPAPHNFVFFIFGHWSEFPGRYGIDATVARQSIRKFVSEPGLPDSIEWEET